MQRNPDSRWSVRGRGGRPLTVAEETNLLCSYESQAASHPVQAVSRPAIDAVCLCVMNGRSNESEAEVAGRLIHPPPISPNINLLL